MEVADAGAPEGTRIGSSLYRSTLDMSSARDAFGNTTTTRQTLRARR